MQPFPITRGVLAVKMITITLLQQMGIIQAKSTCRKSKNTLVKSWRPVPAKKKELWRGMAFWKFVHDFWFGLGSQVWDHLLQAAWNKNIHFFKHPGENKSEILKKAARFCSQGRCRNILPRIPGQSGNFVFQHFQGSKTINFLGGDIQATFTRHLGNQICAPPRAHLIAVFC